MGKPTYVQNIDGQVHPILKEYVINNSATLQVGDFVRLDTNGHLVRVTTGTNILGMLMGVVDSDGGPGVAPDSGTLDTYTVASDNETVAQVKGQVNIAPTSVYEIDADADLGTTSGSKVGARFDLATEASVDESTATTSSAQVALVQTLADDADRGRFVVVERQLG